MVRRRRVARLALALVTAPLILLLGALAAFGQDGEAVLGKLTKDGEPIAGVAIVVRDADGNDVGQATSDADGSWRVDLPGPGEYQIELQVDSLPEGVELRDPDSNPFTTRVRTGRQPPVNFALGEQISAPSAWDRLPQQILNGLKLGLIISVTAVGLSLVFGTTGLINFAHGEFVTLGAVIAWFLNSAGMPIIFAGLIAAAIGLVFGASLEAGLFRRLRRRKVAGFQFLVITVGLSLLLQSILRLWFGSGFQPYRDFRGQPAVTYGPVTINTRDLTIMLLAVLILISVATLLQRTRIGKAMRAVADNRELAEASGIDVAKVVLVVWALGAALAAGGGVLQGLVASVEYLLGFKLLLLMFAAIIVGGLGTAYGAMLGGLLVGLVSEVSTIWFPNEMKSAWALAVLILVLLFRPQGLLGVRERLG